MEGNNISNDENDKIRISVHHEEGDDEEITGFFSNDLSGHANLNIPIVLSCPSQEFITTHLLHNGAIPQPTNDIPGVTTPTDEDEDEKETQEEKQSTTTTSSSDVIFQLQCQTMNERVMVEQVQLESSVWISPCQIQLNVGIVVCANQQHTNNNNQPIVSTLLQVSAQLTTTNDSKSGGSNLLGRTNVIWKESPIVTVPLKLVPACLVKVVEIGAPRAASGATLVSIQISHSNLHTQPVQLTNLALHPGHATLVEKSSNSGDDDSSAISIPSQFHNPNTKINFPSRRIPSLQQQQQQQQHTSITHESKYTSTATAIPTTAVSTVAAMKGGDVVDMSRQVRWAYAPGTSPQYPVVLQPKDAIATVLQIDAIGDGHTFRAPLALTATICNNQKTCLCFSKIEFTTAPSMAMMTDAFRVDMELAHGSNKNGIVGAPISVQLQVTNLSNDTKDLMLLMAKDEERSTHNSGSGSTASAAQTNENSSQTIHTAVVSEVNGYTFGVWGLLSKNSAQRDDGTLRYHRDYDLLAVDAALLLGEVKAHQTKHAQLRFVPLREGTLDIPNLKLYDKISSRWYSCIHMLKIVAASAPTNNATETITTTNPNETKSE